MHYVGDLMTKNVTTLREDDELALAQAQMGHLELRHLPVVKDGLLVGLVTHRDVLKAAAERGLKPAALVRAKDAMKRDVKVVYPETLLREALDAMVENKWGCLPVVKSRTDLTLVGIITESDLVRYAREVVRTIDREGRWGPTLPARA
ncbi:MAG: CBS domain-containing protein [Myxococcaceae bacterium]|nr:CBS domain-containing protein [Myxococcaceae bacterium]